MRRCSSLGIGPGVRSLEALEHKKKQRPPLHGQQEGKVSMGWRQKLALRVALEGKLKPVPRLSQFCEPRRKSLFRVQTRLPGTD